MLQNYCLIVNSSSR